MRIYINEKISIFILITFMLFVCITNKSLLKKDKDIFKRLNSNSNKSAKRTPEKGCMNFYDQCNFEGKIIFQLCDVYHPPIPRLTTEASNPLVIKFKSFELSAFTTLYLDYNIDRIPQEKLRITENVPCISDLFPDKENYEVTILEIKYLE